MVQQLLATLRRRRRSYPELPSIRPPFGGRRSSAGADAPGALALALAAEDEEADDQNATVLRLLHRLEQQQQPQRDSRRRLHRLLLLLHQQQQQQHRPPASGQPSGPLLLASRAAAAAARHGHAADPRLASLLAGLFAAHGALDAAARAFRAVPAPSASLCAAVLLAHVRCGHPAAAAQLYRDMTQDDPRSVTKRRQPAPAGDLGRVFVAGLKAAAGARDLALGRRVHADATRAGCGTGGRNRFVTAMLVDMYCKCGHPDAARAVLDAAPPAARDVVTWTAMVAGYVAAGRPRDALAVYRDMVSERGGGGGGVRPNVVTMVCALQACAAVGSLVEGRAVHCALMAMEQEGRRGRGKQQQQPAAVVVTAVVDMYAKCGDLGAARAVLDDWAGGQGAAAVAPWNAMIAGYAARGDAGAALGLYRRMQQVQDGGAGGAPSPDAATFVALLRACAAAAALATGAALHSDLVAALDPAASAGNPFLTAALVDMYCKCGAMPAARAVFDAVAPAARDAVTWTALVSGYAHLGDARAAFGLYARMRRDATSPPAPDGVLALALLRAAGHAGRAGLARRVVRGMSELGVAVGPEHHGALADALGRAGRVRAAARVVLGMPHGTARGEHWRALLAACQAWKKKQTQQNGKGKELENEAEVVETARAAFEAAVALDPADAAAYVMMGNVYAAAGAAAAAEEVHSRRVRAGAWKQPGRSWWTEDGGRVHAFGADGQPLVQPAPGEEEEEEDLQEAAANGQLLERVREELEHLLARMAD